MLGNGWYMESCVFECGDFPKENQTQAKEQLTLVKLKLAIFYIRCCKQFFYVIQFNALKKGSNSFNK
jgi:hypothetical protein